ncbi:hypothetical protein BH23BAC1_BH23BAC1_31920 [soil metagenome]
MKNLRSLMILLFATLFVTGTAFSADNKIKDEDKTTLKAREAVENASPDDWKTLATSAEKCMKKNVNLKEAASWLDKSLAIKQDPYNLRLKGDYFQINNLPQQALEYYIKSIRAGLATDVNYVDQETQRKIAEISKKNS